MNCQERTGFLFAHACDQEGKEFCALCKKLVCPRHARPSQQGTLCVTCAAKQQPPAKASAAAGAAAGTAAWADDPFFYRDHHYHGSHTYDAGDRSVFDKGSSKSTGGGVESDIQGT